MNYWWLHPEARERGARAALGTECFLCRGRPLILQGETG